EPWDFVVTVCDRAQEACPIFPGQPILAHWGMPDPAEVDGDGVTKRAAFRDAFVLLSRRIDLLLALPLEKLEQLALESRVRAIGNAGSYAANSCEKNAATLQQLKRDDARATVNLSDTTGSARHVAAHQLLRLDGRRHHGHSRSHCALVGTARMQSHHRDQRCRSLGDSPEA